MVWLPFISKIKHSKANVWTASPHREVEDVIWVPGKRLCAVQEHLTIKKRKNWNLNVRSFRVAEDKNRRTNRTTEDSSTYKKGMNITGKEKQNGEEKEGCERGFKICDDPVRHWTRRQQFPPKY
jgi:predicted transposase YbfD/YdcC